MNAHNDCDRARLQPERCRDACSAACGAAGGRAHVFEHAADADCVRVPRTSLETVTCASCCRFVRRCLLHVVRQVVPPTCDLFAPRCTGLRGARCIAHDRVSVALPLVPFQLANCSAGRLHRCAAHCCHSFRRISCALRQARTHARTHEEIAHGTGAVRCAFMGTSCRSPRQCALRIADCAAICRRLRAAARWCVWRGEGRTIAGDSHRLVAKSRKLVSLQHGIAGNATRRCTNTVGPMRR